MKTKLIFGVLSVTFALCANAADLLTCRVTADPSISSYDFSSEIQDADGANQVYLLPPFSVADVGQGGNLYILGDDGYSRNILSVGISPDGVLPASATLEFDPDHGGFSLVEFSPKGFMRVQYKTNRFNDIFLKRVPHLAYVTFYITCGNDPTVVEKIALFSGIKTRFINIVNKTTFYRPHNKCGKACE